MNPEELELFHKSLNRCIANEDFLETFYELFMDSSPEVREKFAHVNWFRQKRMLVASFHMMMVAEEEGTDGNQHLKDVAHTHSRLGRDISPELYGHWLTCLIQSASQYDDQWSEDTETAWRKMMDKGIRYMVARYEDPNIAGSS